MRRVESPFGHVKEVVDAKILFIYVNVHLNCIHFHSGTAWELQFIIGNLPRIGVTSVEWTWLGLV
jgi:hypothetical protein